MSRSKLPIYSALVANLLIAITKFIAAAATGSSAMVSEGIHSVVDTLNEILLLYGIKRSQKKPDEQRPFGYGKELYFWSFVVSILIFAVGGGISFYEGITHIQHPVAITAPQWNYLVLGLAVIFDGISFVIALRGFNRARADMPFWQAIKKSKDPTSFVVLFEDAADVLGLLIALAGVYFGHLLNAPYLDGIASILIGVILTGVSVVLARESRSLLMGETASHPVLQQVVAMVQADPDVLSVEHPRSMFLGPEEIILLLRVSFRNDLSATQVIDFNQRIKDSIKAQFPYFKQIFIEADNLRRELIFSQ